LDEFRSLVVQRCLESWQVSWNRCTGLLHDIKPILQNWADSYKHSRSEQVVLARLRLNTPLFTVLHYFERRAPSQCPLCNVVLNLEHVFIVCPKFSPQRRFLQAKCSSEKIPFTLSYIFSILFPEDLLFTYLRQIAFFNLI